MTLPTMTSSEAATSGARHLAQAPVSEARRLSTWDLAGLLLSVALALAVTRGAVIATGSRLGQMPEILWGALGAGAAALLMVAAAARRGQLSRREVARRLGATWADPPHQWLAFVLGMVLCLPLFGLYAPVLSNDADSARLIGAVSWVQRGHLDFLVDTQDNLLPHLVMGPFIAVKGVAGARVVSILTLLVLGGVCSYIARRLTGSMVATAVCPLVMISIPAIIHRAGYLPMYPAMLALGYLGAWLSYRVIGERAGWVYGVGAGLCLAMAPEAQGVGLLFLCAPLLLAVTAPSVRAAASGLVLVYGSLATFMLPRLLINVREGGLSKVTSFRTDYFVTKGYVRALQEDYFGYVAINEPIPTYLARLPGRFAESLGGAGWVALALALVAVALAKGRARLLSLAGVAAMVVAVTVKPVPQFPRYYSPLWPGIVILAGVLVTRLFTSSSTLRRRLAVGACVGLVVAAGLSYHETSNGLADVNEASATYRPLAAMVDDGRGVIGSRSHSVLHVDAEIPTFGGQFLTEDEWVTFLTWPSEAEVLDVLAGRDIGWVVIHPFRRLELDYHDVWLVPAYGQRARHVDAIATSDAFCLMGQPAGFLVYEVDQCGA